MGTQTNGGNTMIETRRQGDVLVTKLTKAQAEKLKEGAKPIERENGRVVLAHGEATGHFHAISAEKVNFLVNEGSLQRILEVREPASLMHEEHRAFQLPVGDYEVTIQREYSPSSIRDVQD
jgi:predicted phosphodiesterase